MHPLIVPGHFSNGFGNPPSTKDFTVVPMLMRREGIDMWILIAREYNEDPVVETMLPATWLSARRRTVLIFLIPAMARQSRICLQVAMRPARSSPPQRSPNHSRISRLESQTKCSCIQPLCVSHT